MAVWLTVMAICLALALAAWIFLVFRSERHEPEQMHESSSHREVIGGKFDAHAGGRQVMPDPHGPLTPEEPQPQQKAAEQSTGQAPHGQAGGVPEQAPARGDRP